MSLKSLDPLVQNNIDSLLKIDDVQQYLQIGATTVYKMERLGLLTPIRFSKRLVRYRASEVATLIESAAKNGGVL